DDGRCVVVPMFEREYQLRFVNRSPINARGPRDKSERSRKHNRENCFVKRGDCHYSRAPRRRTDVSKVTYLLIVQRNEGRSGGLSCGTSKAFEIFAGHQQIFNHGFSFFHNSAALSFELDHVGGYGRGLAATATAMQIDSKP